MATDNGESALRYSADDRADSPKMRQSSFCTIDSCEPGSLDALRVLLGAGWAAETTGDGLARLSLLQRSYWLAREGARWVWALQRGWQGRSLRSPRW